MLQLESYDGSIDPIGHLESFKVLMLLHGAIDRILCWDFSSTLWKAARYWYFSLKPNPIYTIEQLSRSFTAHFVSRRRQNQGSNFLVNIKQWEGGSFEPTWAALMQPFLRYMTLVNQLQCLHWRMGSRSVSFSSRFRRDIKGLRWDASLGEKIYQHWRGSQAAWHSNWGQSRRKKGRAQS